ncbi:hypothetical protein LPJ66_000139 [Kickxella alabastrina]|uniref:Uncharacterized protein n=1 Tax=Kickxella alabastrina TaxID=61397 RepID=A0ACC1IWP8_9FUNG|nr:hypothetical protein LPJ66_000139 [Kickxella alabastrina]
MDMDLLGDDIPTAATPSTAQRTLTPPSGVPLRTSLDDLLLLCDEDTQDRKLQPAMQPQSNSTGDQILSSTSDPAGLDEEETDDFGDFLQGNQDSSEFTSGAVSGNALGLKMGDLKVNEKLNTKLMAFLPLTPRPPKDGVVCTGPRPSTVRDPKDAAAEKILGWMAAAAAPIPAGGSDAGAGDVIGNAWETAAGLMGGSHLGHHIGEIASRLCNVIPADTLAAEQATYELNQVDGSDGVGLVESPGPWESLAGNLEPGLQDMAGQDVEHCIRGIVWPWAGSSELSKCSSEGAKDVDLVQAYLRLAQIAKDPDQPADIATDEIAQL